MTKNNKRTVAIIGGGLGGLTTACYLARDGFDVTIYEKNDKVGGRASYFVENGHYFDMGPSWYWIPQFFDKFFDDFGKKTTNYYELVHLDPSYRVFFDANEFIDIPADLNEFYKIIENLEPGSSKKLARILEDGKQMLDIAVNKFLYRSYASILDMLVPEIAIEGIKKGAFFSLESLIKKNFKNEKLRKLVTWHALFLGASPKNLPALYSFMLNVDFIMGTWYPKGGMYKVIDAAVSLAQELGVKIATNSEVSKINVENGIATSFITTKNETIIADVIVANADYHHVETSLLETKWQSIPEKKWQTKTVSPSTVLFYLGINTKLKKSLHHNYYFSLETWDDHFDSLFGKARWPKGIPSYYYHATSKTDPKAAPEGGESIFVLVPVASGLDDTDEKREELFNRIMEHLEQITETPIRQHLTVKRIISHRDQKALYNAYLGNNFGLAQTLFQTGSFRPYNQSRKVNNLFYVGHYTHPGIGLPMVIISGKVTADLVLSQYAKH